MAKNKLAKLTSTDEGPSAAPSGYKQTAEDKMRERRYKAEDALRCLTRANEIIKDRELMKDVEQLVKEQAKTHKAVLAHAKEERRETPSDKAA